MFCKIYGECPNGYLICCEECKDKDECDAACKNNSDECKLCVGKYDDADTDT